MLTVSNGKEGVLFSRPELKTGGAGWPNAGAGAYRPAQSAAIVKAGDSKSKVKLPLE
jgi:hypothetical protein